MEIEEDVWVPTQYARCCGGCGIRVGRINGAAVKIEGRIDTEGKFVCVEGEGRL